ncbi:hypothetical protein OH77DRAFT_1403237 [Trametes cingulata]|nr:hypothetical protein OH77DRAFT_1403237 [Trametes cingulata]
MTSTLDDELSSSRLVARAALENKQAELTAEEQDIAESRVRYEAERVLNFYDELSDSKAAEQIPTTIRQLKRIERRVAEATSQALRLASLPLDDTTHITEYTGSLDTLERLEAECGKLHVEVQTLLRLHTGHSRLSQVLANLSDIIRGHEENVACAKSVVQCCKENYRMGIETLTLG